MTRTKNRMKAEGEGSSKRPCVRSPKRERDVLNDGLLSLYKKELDSKKEQASTSQDESNTENKSKENGADTSKTPSKAGKRSKNAALTPKYSTVDFNDIGGMDEVFGKILCMFRHYEMLPKYKKRKISPVSGILLHGPPGCGKTYLAHAIAGEIGVPIIEVSATELVCGISGESEGKIRDVFAAALATGHCILFIDEIDAICRKRETNENAMLGRMVTQMIKCFDELRQKDPDGKVVVIGATNLPDSLDGALRRGSRFTHEIAIGLPDEDGRLDILKTICKDSLPSDFDFRWLAHHTPGYVGADLAALVSMAQMKALDRDVVLLPPDKNKKYEEDSDDPPGIQPTYGAKNWFSKWFKVADCPDEEISCTLDDFKAALQEFVPSSKREGFASVPDTTWDEIGAYENIKEKLRETILWPVEDHKLFESYKATSGKGILLYGPKGCGKTLLAKAIANECSINFLAVNGPELLNMYVGESEKAVRKVFERARNSSPCIIFFDEFDALCPPRSSSKENAPVERVVNQLLTEASGISGRKQVFLIAATNRLDKIDSAMLRPGRLDKILYVGLPLRDGRVEILKSLLKDKTLQEGLELEQIAFDKRCDYFSGADLTYLVDEAFLKAIKEMRTLGLKREGKVVLCMRHFDEAFKEIKPSISEEERRYYERISTKDFRT